MNPIDILIELFNESKKKNSVLLANPIAISGKLATAGGDYDIELVNYIINNKLALDTDVLAVLRYNAKDNRCVIYFELIPSVVEKITPNPANGKEYIIYFNPDASFWTFEAEANKDYYFNHNSEVFKNFKPSSTTLLLDSRTYNHPGIGRVNPGFSLKDASDYIKQWL